MVRNNDTTIANTGHFALETHAQRLHKSKTFSIALKRSSLTNRTTIEPIWDLLRWAKIKINAVLSSLTDKEWKSLNPSCPSKPDPKWTKRQILDGVFYQLKNGCNWGDLRLTALFNRVLALQAMAFRGVLDGMMSALHAQVRVQKTEVDAIVNYRLTSCEEYVPCQY